MILTVLAGVALAGAATFSVVQTAADGPSGHAPSSSTTITYDSGQ
jgi:hypothetical protein